jgi:hypothetical protein
MSLARAWRTAQSNCRHSTKGGLTPRYRKFAPPRPLWTISLTVETMKRSGCLSTRPERRLRTVPGTSTPLVPIRTWPRRCSGRSKAPHPVSLLGVRAERPCHHTADRSDELPPPHEHLPRKRTCSGAPSNTGGEPRLGAPGTQSEKRARRSARAQSPRRASPAAVP